MTDPDKSIDRVLQALRDTEPAAGFELRILRGLESRTAQPFPRGRQRLIPLVRRLSRGFAVAAAACVFALIFGLIHKQRDRHPAGANQILATATSPALAVPVAKTDFPGAVPFAGGRLIAGVTSQASARVTAPAVHLRTGSLRQGRISPSTYDLLAMRETSAPSIPPPPMPLTEQEKLLMRLARRDRPEEVALLNPDARARRDAEGKAEFADFFEHPIAEHPVANETN